MRKLVRFALSIGTATLFASCGELQAPISAPGTIPQSRAIKNQALLYVVANNGYANFVTYPEGEKVGSIDFGLYSYLTAACSDRSGNVWIVNYGALDKYAYGSTKAIRIRSLPFGVAGCAADLASNDLAAVGQGGVGVIRNERGKAHVYHTKSYYKLRSCGYDASGDLFVDGVQAYNGSAVFLELPSGSSKLVKLTLGKKIGDPGQIQWDGHYVAIQDRKKPYDIYQVSFSGNKGTVMNTVTFTGLRKPVMPSWIQGATAIVPYSQHGKFSDAVGFFNYPAGGAAIKVLSGRTYVYAMAVTITPASAP